jgi:hypothetical protein
VDVAGQQSYRRRKHNRETSAHRWQACGYVLQIVVWEQAPRLHNAAHMPNSRNVLIVESPSGGREVTRREFTVDSIMALFAGVAITVTTAACGGDDNPSAPDGSRSGVVEANHGHSAVVTAAQITAGNSVTLTLAGSDHTHTVDLTGAEVVQIGNGTRVTKQSSNDASGSFGAHAHAVTFN